MKKEHETNSKFSSNIDSKILKSASIFAKTVNNTKKELKNVDSDK